MVQIVKCEIASNYKSGSTTNTYMAICYYYRVSQIERALFGKGVQKISGVFIENHQQLFWLSFKRFVLIDH